jgi:hypothetical protein
MVYGHSAGDTGHGDVRLVVVKPPTDEIRALVLGHGLTLPKSGDVALLEWPTLAAPTFRLTLLDPTSTLYTQTAAQLDAAEANNQLVGQGACWLPPGFSPSW